MGFFSKLFSKSGDETTKSGGMEDYMTLIRVYFQAVLASRLGINNLAMLPDLRTYKQTFHVPTLHNKLGLGEMASVMQDVQPYLYQFQGFTQDLMMLIGNLMKFKLRVPGFFKKAIYTMTEKTVNDIYDKNDFSDAGVIKAVVAVRQYNQRLRFSRKWTTDFVYQIVTLAKKEPKPAEQVESK